MRNTENKVYAVKVGGHWYIAVKVDGGGYSKEFSGTEVWSDPQSTALITKVGEESKSVLLEE